MKKRLFGILLALAVCLGLLSVTALAASDPETFTFDISEGSVTIVDGTETGKIAVQYGTDVTAVDNIDPTQTITVTGSTTQYEIKINTATAVTVKASNLTIDRSGQSNKLAMGLTNASANVTLILDGENTFHGGYNCAGISVGEGRTLTIKGNGSVTAKGSSNGAGIGGSYAAGGTIIIEEGAVTAIGGGDSAGIGGGDHGSGGTVTIKGGTVTATGGGYGSGIGGGYGCVGGEIIIEGGNVTAKGGGNGAGIGGGSYADGGTVTIKGGNVTATGNGGAGIGGGYRGSGGTVTITGGTVTATGNSGGDGIGKGYTGSSNGTLSSGDSGNAWITANKVPNTSRFTSGVLNGKVYGSVTLTEDRSVTDLIIPSGNSLTVPAGKTLTIAGVGSIDVAGELTVAEGGTLKKYDLSGYTPVLDTREDNNSITLKTVFGAEYRCGESGAWQDSSSFSGLTESTQYNFYVKVNEDNPYYVGESQPLLAHTLPHLYTYTSHGSTYHIGTCTFCGENTYALDHSFGEGIDSVGENGLTYTASSCTDCGHVKTVLKAAPHIHEIATQEQLDAFANDVNSGNGGINARLTVDGLEMNTPIAKSGNYTGTFDGGNHTLQVTLAPYAYNSNYTVHDHIAPFASVKGATIKNLRTTGTIKTGGKYAAGLVGMMFGAVNIENCYSDVVITSTCSGAAYNGGLVGHMRDSSANLTLKNCGFAGKINGSSATTCGGLVGYAESKGLIQTLTVENCYVAGVFATKTDGCDTICPTIGNAASSVSNFYYLNQYGGLAGGNTDLQANCTKLNAGDFLSGEAAWRLRGGETDNGSAWGQKIGTETYPLPNGDTVYKTTGCVTYSNDSSNIGTKDHGYDENGICTNCGAFDTTITTYTISTQAQLDAFVQIVNDGNVTLNANLAGNHLILKRPIGQNGAYKGIFDGQNNTLEVALTDADNTAPFAALDGATIKNLRTTGTIDASGRFAAGLAGIVQNTVTIENCYSDVDIISRISGNGSYGGLVGSSIEDTAANVTIRNCGFTGTITGANTTSCGGLMGYIYGNHTLTIENCYVAGVFATKTDGCDTICRNIGSTGEDNVVHHSVTNCCYLAQFGGLAGGNTDLQAECTQLTAEQFASGEAAYLLNGSQTAEASVWGQTIGTDSYPIPNDSHKVYQTSPCVAYTNDKDATEKAHNDVHGICAVCGNTVGTISDSYLIDSQDALNAFVAAVNKGNVTLNAKLTVDNLTLNTPVGQDADGKRYTGIFDGGNHTLKVELSGGESIAPFAAVENATIKNLRTTGTIEASGKFAAGLVSNVWRTVTIENCYSDVIINSTVVGDGTHGGLVGRSNHNGFDTDDNHANITIRNCGFTGEINGSNTNYCCGLMGYVHQGQTLTIENCYVAGEFNTNIVGCSTICRSGSNVNLTIQNCYYLNVYRVVGNSCRKLTAEQFAGGEAAWLLNGSTTTDSTVWGQTIGTDAYPIPGGATVNRLNDLRCDGQPLDTYSFSNSATATVPDHTLENVAEVPATCTTDGVKAHQHCTICEKNVIEGVEKTDEELKIAELGHRLGDVPEVPATCTTDGVKAHQHCTICEKNFIESVEKTDEELKIAAPGHRLEDVPEVPATCTTDGVKAHQHCTICEKNFIESVEKTAAELKISATGHTPGEWEHDSTQHWRLCTGCKTELDRADHAFSGNTCSVCGYSLGNPFVDVKSGKFYYDAVLWAVNNDITKGTTDTTFSPNDPCTRAQTVSFLWRAAGSPAPKSTEMPFTDVAKGRYYYDAVLWAVENGITEGTSATTFSPGATCTRAQFVTFLWRAQGKPSAGTTNPFTDVAEKAYYANAVRWAVENGITEGTTATTFSPNQNCTRAQTVTFLYRCLGK